MVPRYLEERDVRSRLDDDEVEDPNDLSPTIVVCSGELVEQVRASPVTS